ncbi:YebC-like protein [Gyrodon lividus]|nr:YebC-like protein [Gyrodon lividus]
MFSRAHLVRSRHLVPRGYVSLSVRTLSTTPMRFAGHSKWSKIKHRKGVEDAKRSKIYGKAAREILAAAKSGGSTNPGENGLLATAIRRAKDAGVPKENVEKALVKAERNEGHGQAMLFEAIINGTTGIIIECRSDNANRTVKNINHTLTSYRARDDMEGLLDQIMDVCSIDFADWSEESGQRGVELVCRPEVLNKVMKVIRDHASASPLCEVLASEINWAPLESQEVEDDEGTARLECLIEALEEDDDVERVYTTVEPNRLIADC